MVCLYIWSQPIFILAWTQQVAEKVGPYWHNGICKLGQVGGCFQVFKWFFDRVPQMLNMINNVRGLSWPWKQVEFWFMFLPRPPSDQFCYSWAHKRHFFLYFCDTKDTLDDILYLKPILCKVCFVVSWDILCDALALNLAVICCALAYLFKRTVRATLLSPTVFFQNIPYRMKFFFLNCYSLNIRNTVG